MPVEGFPPTTEAGLRATDLTPFATTLRHRAADQPKLPGYTPRRWAGGRRKPGLRQMGVDEIYLGKKQKFLTVVSNLQTGEPLWFGGSGSKQPETNFSRKS